MSEKVAILSPGPFSFSLQEAVPGLLQQTQQKAQRSGLCLQSFGILAFHEYNLPAC